MTKAELVGKVAAAMRLPKHQTETVVNLFLQCITDALEEGDKVELRGFGSFRLHHRRPRAGRNPKTGETVQIPAKKVPWFKPTVSLGVTYAVVYTYGCDDGRIAPTRCAVIDA